jgi:hypothetical protein
MGMDYRQGSVARAHGVKTRTGGRDTRAAHTNCRICILAATIGAIGSLGTVAQPLPAEFIVTNAAVYTVDSHPKLGASRSRCAMDASCTSALRRVPRSSKGLAHG